MEKYFNVNADCKAHLHYMVDLRPKLKKIKEMVDRGDYFTINRARQYGKTTTMKALSRFLQNDYVVIWLDFQMLSFSDFETEHAFVNAFARETRKAFRPEDRIPPKTKETLKRLENGSAANTRLASLTECFINWCKASEKPVVLMIDEVDSASNNQVFLDFLAQLRGSYINRDMIPSFQSVILAGVYDVKNMRLRLRPEDEHKRNSPWNTHEDNEPSENLLSFGDCPWDQMVVTPFDIAADFLVDMSFSSEEIAGMLKEYEGDHHTGMDIPKIAGLLYDYTSGYPYLVSRICKLIDERLAGGNEYPDGRSAWTKEGFLTAIRILLAEPNTLFDSLINKLADYPKLERLLYGLLFQGKEISYVVGVPSMEMAVMFGFIKIENHLVLIANRIFETLLYNLFLTAPDMQQEELYDAAQKDKNLFVENGCLNMKKILERFVVHFDSLYGDRGQKFYEDDGRRYFMLFLKPIINGQGNCYVETETRNRERTDLVVDYRGEQFVIETKIWHGPARHVLGERQLAQYLDHYQLQTGYLLTFNFNQNKKIGVTEITLKNKTLVEATV